MTSETRWLRASYWAGAIVDGIAAIAMLATAVFGVEGASGFSPDVGYRYAMGIGGSLMVGWTALLIWGDRRPVERKGILVLTVCPVITGIVITEIAIVVAGAVPLAKMLPGILAPLVAAALMTFSYLRVSRAQG